MKIGKRPQNQKKTNVENWGPRKFNSAVASWIERGVTSERKKERDLHDWAQLQRSRTKKRDK